MAVIGGADADAGAVDDGFRHCTEPGAPVDAALQHDIAFLHRVDAEAREAVEVGGLDMARDQRDLDRPGIQHHRWPHVHLHAARHWSAVAIATVRYDLDRAGHVQRRAVGRDRRHRDLAADRQADLGADPGSDRLLHRFRIVDCKGGDIFESLPQDLCQHDGRVHCASRGAIIIMVEQYDRPLACSARRHRPGAGDRLLQWLDIVNKGLALDPGAVQ